MCAFEFSQQIPLLLSNIIRARVTVFGDFCVDAYWSISEETPEASLETGLSVRHVSQQRYFLGGAGSVLANLAALGVGKIRAIGLAGTDPFGAQLRGLLAEAGAEIAGFVFDYRVDTMVYAKPYLGEREDSRFDFGAFNCMPPDLLEKLIHNLEAAAEDSDVVVLNQQIQKGLSTPETIARINEIIARHPETAFLVDSRHHGGMYSGAIHKLNMREASHRLGKEQEEVPAEDWAKDLALKVSEESGKTTFLTRGEFGIVVADNGEAIVISGIPINGPTDAVGAGDAVVAAISAALAAGASPVLAAGLANIAAMITVKKIRTTGTASSREILAALNELDHVYR